ncbi:hypothetical protein [Oceanobacillus luteolus]|uniref:YqzM family protein n=1 Tax=Oceanobacillus luteolus TaxID=1274358 RepID=A0ABW4HS41_9BACI
MGFWKDEWNKMDEVEKKGVINTFKTPVYLIIAIFFLIVVINSIASTL